MPAAPVHVAVIGNQMATMVRFRGSLIRRLGEGGARVTGLCPPGSAGEEAELRALGADFVPLSALRRTSTNPVHDLQLLAELVRRLRALRPTHVLSYFLKPAIYGTTAARLVGVPRRVALIEGLGFAFTAGEALPFRRRALSGVAAGLLRAGLANAHAVVALNRDDEAFLARRAGVSPFRLHRMEGIGLDLDAFPTAPPVLEPVTFLLVARLLREKGVREFAAAARIVKAQAPQARLVLVGGLDDPPGGVRRAEIEAWVREGLVEWTGQLADVRPRLAAASVFVLPSWREGMPVSTMEAMATGRPVITTTAPGCRDSVTPGVSGVLVPPRDPEALAEAMLRFVREPELIASMGAAAADEARRRYDARRQDAFLAELLLGPSSR